MGIGDSGIPPQEQELMWETMRLLFPIMRCSGGAEGHSAALDKCPGCAECEYCACGHRLYCKDV